MEIDDKHERTVRLEMDETDLISLFVDKTDMGDIDDFKLMLASKDGNIDVNSGITGIVLVGKISWGGKNDS